MAFKNSIFVWYRFSTAKKNFSKIIILISALSKLKTAVEKIKIKRLCHLDTFRYVNCLRRVCDLNMI